MKPIKKLLPHIPSMLQSGAIAASVPGGGPTALFQGMAAAGQNLQNNRMAQVEQELIAQKQMLDMEKFRQQAQHDRATLDERRDYHQGSLNQRRSEQDHRQRQDQIQNDLRAIGMGYNVSINEDGSYSVSPLTREQMSLKEQVEMQNLEARTRASNAGAANSEASLPFYEARSQNAPRMFGAQADAAELGVEQEMAERPFWSQNAQSESEILQNEALNASAVTAAGLDRTRAAAEASRASTRRGRPLDMGTRSRYEDIMSGLSEIEALERLISTNEESFGPISGRMASLPWATKARTTQAAIEKATQIIGKGLEGGVLRQDDIVRYRLMLPQVTDTPEVARGKLKTMGAAIKIGALNRLATDATGGADVEGMRAMMEQRFPSLNPSDEDILLAAGRTMEEVAELAARKGVEPSVIMNDLRRKMLYGE